MSPRLGAGLCPMKRFLDFRKPVAMPWICWATVTSDLNKNRETCCWIFCLPGLSLSKTTKRVEKALPPPGCQPQSLSLNDSEPCLHLWALTTCLCVSHWVWVVPTHTQAEGFLCPCLCLENRLGNLMWAAHPTSETGYCSSSFLDLPVWADFRDFVAWSPIKHDTVSVELIHKPPCPHLAQWGMDLSPKSSPAFSTEMQILSPRSSQWIQGRKWEQGWMPTCELDHHSYR